MTIQIITRAFAHYLSIPYEMFTAKIIAGFAIFQVLDNFEKKDIERLEFIEENTHEKVLVSIYKLDRNINPTKEEVVARPQHKFRFRKNGDWEDTDVEKDITLTENTMQYYLCMAIREVNDIIFKNLKPYKLERIMSMDEDDSGGFQFGSAKTKK